MNNEDKNDTPDDKQKRTNANTSKNNDLGSFADEDFAADSQAWTVNSGIVGSAGLASPVTPARGRSGRSAPAVPNSPGVPGTIQINADFGDINERDIDEAGEAFENWPEIGAASPTGHRGPNTARNTTTAAKNSAAQTVNDASLPGIKQLNRTQINVSDLKQRAMAAQHSGNDSSDDESVKKPAARINAPTNDVPHAAKRQKTASSSLPASGEPEAKSNTASSQNPRTAAVVTAIVPKAHVPAVAPRASLSPAAPRDDQWVMGAGGRYRDPNQPLMKKQSTITNYFSPGAQQPPKTGVATAGVSTAEAAKAEGVSRAEATKAKTVDLTNDSDSDVEFLRVLPRHIRQEPARDQSKLKASPPVSERPAPGALKNRNPVAPAVRDILWDDSSEDEAPAAAPRRAVARRFTRRQIQDVARAPAVTDADGWLQTKSAKAPAAVSRVLTHPAPPKVTRESEPTTPRRLPRQDSQQSLASHSSSGSSSIDLLADTPRREPVVRRADTDAGHRAEVSRLAQRLWPAEANDPHVSVSTKRGTGSSDSHSSASSLATQPPENAPRNAAPWTERAAMPATASRSPQAGIPSHVRVYHGSVNNDLSAHQSRAEGSEPLDERKPAAKPNASDSRSQDHSREGREGR